MSKRLAIRNDVTGPYAKKFARMERTAMENEPLLKTDKYMDIISTFTAQEVQEAEELLQDMFKDLKNLNSKKFAILSYLIGIRQGYHELQSETAAASISQRIIDVYNKGKADGITEAMLLFGYRGGQSWR